MKARASEIRPRGDSAERLRDAGERLFLEHGFSATSTDAICREARVSKEALYSYYGGKEGLLVAVLEKLLEDDGRTRVTDIAPDRRRHRHLREELVDFANSLMSDLLRPKYVALTRLIVGELSRQPQLSEIFRHTIAQRSFRTVVDLLQDQHLDPALDINVAARAFVGGLLTYFLLDGLLRAGQPRRPTKARLAAHVDVLIRSVGLS